MEKTQNKVTDSTLITFRAISNFVNDLTEIFGTHQRPLKLYCHLINKTTLTHDKAIQKHIENFKVFCVNNRSAIMTKNINQFTQPKIIYSERVFIDITNIFSNSDRETSETIFSHLLTISALVDPAGKAKEVLKELKNQSGVEGSGGETDFISNILEKVEQHVDPNANPMEMVSSIMQSGVFNELVTGMGNGVQNGTLDLGKLMGSVQKMMGNLDLGTNNGNNSETGQPDLSGMMSMLPGMMSMLGGLGNISNNTNNTDVIKSLE